jgi:hypothetical protein
MCRKERANLVQRGDSAVHLPVSGSEFPHHQPPSGLPKA